MALHPILIVDDHAANVAIYENVIRELAHCVAHCFTDPAQALQWCEGNQPALALVDYHMPAIDGLEFVRRFRALPDRANVPILMLTGERDASIRAEALAAGVIDVLSKPFDKAQFLRYARNLIFREVPSGASTA